MVLKPCVRQERHKYSPRTDLLRESLLHPDRRPCPFYQHHTSNGAMNLEHSCHRSSCVRWCSVLWKQAEAHSSSATATLGLAGGKLCFVRPASTKEGKRSIQSASWTSSTRVLCTRMRRISYKATHKTENRLFLIAKGQTLKWQQSWNPTSIEANGRFGGRERSD